MGQAPGLQRALRALGFGAHVGAPAGARPTDIHGDDTVVAAHEPDEITLGTPLPTAEARAGRDMPHVPVAGGPASGAGAAGASASRAGSARAASHSSAAA